MQLSVSMLALSAMTLAGGNALAGAAIPAIPPDWITINAGGIFTLRAPPGSVFVLPLGLINNAGGVRGPGFEIHYQYAFDTDDLSCAKESKNYAAQQIDLDSRPAIIVAGSGLSSSCNDGEYANFVGLYAATAFPTYARPAFRKLTMWGSVAQEQYSSTLKLMYQTIHFTQ